jgi:hypothetical protein
LILENTEVWPFGSLQYSLDWEVHIRVSICSISSNNIWQKLAVLFSTADNSEAECKKNDTEPPLCTSTTSCRTALHSHSSSCRTEEGKSKMRGWLAGESDLFVCATASVGNPGKSQGNKIDLVGR